MNDTVLEPVPGKEYKVFLVEVDDDERERVLAGRVRAVQVKVEPEYHSIHTGYSDTPTKQFQVSQEVTMTLDMIPSEDGTYLTIEDFSKDEE